MSNTMRNPIETIRSTRTDLGGTDGGGPSAAAPRGPAEIVPFPLMRQMDTLMDLMREALWGSQRQHRAINRVRSYMRRVGIAEHLVKHELEAANAALRNYRQEIREECLRLAGDAWGRPGRNLVRSALRFDDWHAVDFRDRVRVLAERGTLSELQHIVEHRRQERMARESRCRRG